MNIKTDAFIIKAKAKHGDRYDYSAANYVASKTKLQIGCRVHGSFAMTPNSHLNGQGCHRCGAEASAAAKREAASRTWASFVEDATKAHAGRYRYIHEGQKYVLKDAKVRVVCAEHGEFIQQSSVHLNGHGCKRCGLAVSVAAVKLDADVFMDSMRARHPTLQFLSTYTRAHDPLTARCTVHNFEFTRRAFTFNHYGCGKCGHEQGGIKLLGNLNREGHNDLQRASAQRTFVAWAETYVGPMKLRLDTYTTISALMRAVCPVHGDVAVIPKNLVRGHGCVRCAHDESRGLRTPLAVVQARFAEKFGDAFEYDWTTLRGTHYPMTITCKKHGKFQSTPHNFLSTAFGCPTCGRGMSRGQQEVAEFVKSLGFAVENDVWNVLPQIGRSRAQIDIWVPEKRFGIEYHGIYFHAEREPGCEISKTKHRDKWQRAVSAGIKLFQVFEDEWVLRRKAVENRIKSALGVAEKRHARKLTLALIDSGDAAVQAVYSFFEQWHTQGVGRHASRYYVLKDGADIVAAMGFVRTGHAGAKALADYELSRFAVLGSVVGGFSRLLKAAVADIGTSIMSYCDLRYGSGEGYARCGFVEVGLTDPDWWWLPGNTTGKRIGRQASQAQRIKANPQLKAVVEANPTLVGDQIAYAAGWRKVYGAGSKRFVYRS